MRPSFSPFKNRCTALSAAVLSGRSLPLPCFSRTSFSLSYPRLHRALYPSDRPASPISWPSFHSRLSTRILSGLRFLPAGLRTHSCPLQKSTAVSLCRSTYRSCGSARTSSTAQEADDKCLCPPSPRHIHNSSPPGKYSPFFRQEPRLIMSRSALALCTEKVRFPVSSENV